jgi:hypothetical protein
MYVRSLHVGAPVAMSGGNRNYGFSLFRDYWSHLVMSSGIKSSGQAENFYRIAVAVYSYTKNGGGVGV